MAWDRGTKVRSLLRRFEQAVIAAQDANDAVICIPLEAFDTHMDEAQAAIECKLKAERKLNELRGKVFRAAFNSTEKL